jgi:hypothetical protein
LESVAHYFPKGYDRPPGVESVPDPRETGAVVFEDFFVAGLHMPPHPIIVDILRKFWVQLHQLTPSAIIQISKFIWPITSCGGHHYELHYQNKKVHLVGSDTTFTAQFGSTMTLLCHLAEAPSFCGPKNADFAAFIEATSIIGGHNAVEEFLSCDFWPLSEKFGFRVKTKESPWSKVVMSMSQVTTVIGAYESKAGFEACIVYASNLLVGNYNVAKHNTYQGLRHG